MQARFEVLASPLRHGDVGGQPAGVLVDGELVMDRRKGSLAAVHAVAGAALDADPFGGRSHICVRSVRR